MSRLQQEHAIKEAEQDGRCEAYEIAITEAKAMATAVWKENLDCTGLDRLIVILEKRLFDAEQWAD